MIPLRLYLMAGGAVLALGMGYAGGSKIEHNRHASREVAAVARIEAARAKLQTAFDDVAATAAKDAVVQTQTFTEIRRVAGPIVYRNVAVCIPAADSGLLDRARDAANSSTVAGQSDGGAAIAPIVPPQR